MTPEQFRKIGEAFREARLVLGAERALHLDRIGPRGDPVRDEVEALLAESELPTPILDQPVVPEGAAITLAQDVSETTGPGLFVGATIGEFRVARLIGAGSMGEVYEAEQQEPRRRIALKLVSSMLGSGELGRRLRQESAILARLTHPGIAQVYRAGVAETRVGERTTSVPYLAMELVEDAVPITLYADEQGLDVRRRIELLAGVCDAVHHGHQRGVIHRDLKPANILIERSTGRSKVIDFGVARMIEPDGAATIGTAHGQLVGTLAYMSPEQFSSESDIDTRADVYALGTVLLELLCGKPPIDVAGKGLAEVLQTISRQQPRTLASVQPSLAGDLDTIVSKALARDRGDRYASAAQLADDLRRYLNDLPIEARPPTMLHQLRLLARRNKVLVGASITVAGALSLATVVSSGMAVYAIRQARAAVEARNAADAERARAVKVAQFMQGALGSSNPYLPMRLPQEVVDSEFDYWADWRPSPWPYSGKPGQAATPADILNSASLRLEEAFAQDPESLASVGTVLGRALYNLDGPDHGLSALRRAVDAARRAHGDDHEVTIRATLMLAEARGRWDRADKASVRELYQRAIDACTRLHGAGNHRTLDAVRLSAYDLAAWDFAYADGAAMLLRAVDDAATHGQKESLTALRLKAYAGFMLGLAGQFDRAEALEREAIEQINRFPGPRSPLAAEAWDELAQTLRSRGGRNEESLEAQKTAISILSENYGEHCYQALGLRNRLASGYVLGGNWSEAARLFRQLGDDYERLLGETRYEVIANRIEAAIALCNADEMPEARINLASFAARMIERNAKPGDPTLLQQTWLSRLIVAEGRMALNGDDHEIRILLGEADNETQPSLVVRQGIARYRLANRLIHLGKLEEAKTLLDEAAQRIAIGATPTSLAARTLAEIRGKLDRALQSPIRK